MFTGIIENTGIIQEIISSGSNKIFWIESSLSNELNVDQSLSHNGVCLTVEKIKGNQHTVTAIEETILKTNLAKWEKGTVINLERCLPLNGRLDGHLVQGHVDAVALCIDLVTKAGSWEYTFGFAEQFAMNIIEKGSITINGISLTLFNISKNTFTVAIIPYTYEHTNMRFLKKGDSVNVEFDMIGKYVLRMLSFK